MQDNLERALPRVEYERRRDLMEQVKTIDGADARLVGLRCRFPIIQNRETGAEYEYSWETVARICAAGGHFQTGAKARPTGPIDLDTPQGFKWALQAAVDLAIDDHATAEPTRTAKDVLSAIQVRGRDETRHPIRSRHGHLRALLATYTTTRQMLNGWNPL